MTPENLNSPDLPPNDELLDRAVATLRDLPVPDGPPLAVVEKTRDALRRRAGELDSHRRLFLRPAFLSLAAGILILLGMLLIYRSAFHRHQPDIVKTGGGDRRAVPVEPSHSPSTPDKAHIEPPTPTPLVKDVNPEPPAPATVVLADGVISGRVWFDGAPPVPTPLPASNLMAECLHVHGGPIYDESLVVGPQGTLANVVVSVSSGLSGWLREEYPPPPGPAVLDQKGCVFLPHVVAVMVGEPLLVKNSDPFLHNVHMMAVNNPEANLGQPTVGEMATAPFESPEVFRVKCDVHPWMQAWVRVVDNPFFCVTGSDGQFSLRGLPPGTYTLKAWHEQLGVREMQVTIGPGKGASADFVFNTTPPR